jgi:hypothetical protein
MKAFPSTEPVYKNDIVGMKASFGMDLRDYFAGQVIVGFLANPSTDYSSRLIVGLAYEMADEMMRAREK